MKDLMEFPRRVTFRFAHGTQTCDKWDCGDAGNIRVTVAYGDNERHASILCVTHTWPTLDYARGLLGAEVTIDDAAIDALARSFTRFVERTF